MTVKRIISVFLALVFILSLYVEALSVQESEIALEDVGRAMNTVSDSLKSLGDTASGKDASALADTFTQFMDVATTAGKLLTLVNGSTTFLKLIGIMTDPVREKLDGIMSSLQIIDERLSGMDDKLNSLTSAMSEIKASVEFNSRAEKAILYEGSWRDFEYRYMENGMDKLITEYNSMLRTGLMDWCNGERTKNGIDNSKITVLYKKTADGYRLTFSDQNKIPSDITAEDRWIMIPSECLPESFAYDVNTFNEALAGEISSNIKNALSSARKDIIETQSFPDFEENIDEICADAVNTLVFRTASTAVNGNADFAGEVSRQFTNYCNHLQTSGDGIDAALKTLYLTHAFEYSISEDIRDFCDRMIILTGTYGMFASNVLGISRLTTDSEKENAVSRMTSAIQMTEDAKKNGITGYGDYCYITGTRLVYGAVYFEASAEITAHYTLSNTTYEAFRGNAPTYVYGGCFENNAVPCGDSAMLVVCNTLLSNGITPSHDYFNQNIGNGRIKNFGKTVTGMSGMQTLSFDGKTPLHVEKVFGDYFRDNSTISSLPGDAESEYVVFRKKISGSLYDIGSGELTSNTTLCAIAVYGENHFYWVTDEGAFMGGPSNSDNFTDEYSETKTGSDSTGVIRKHKYTTENSYNILLSVPQRRLNDADDYNPLVQLEEDVGVISYNEAEYEDESAETEAEVSENVTTDTSEEAAETTEAAEKSPQTGDSEKIIAIIMLSALLCTLLCVSDNKRKSKKM